MTEKITITQEQSDAINWVLSACSVDNLIVKHARNNGGYVGRAKALKGMSAIKLTKALRVGYEIELKFKAGDWVAYLDGSNIYPKGDVKVVEVGSVSENYVRPVNNSQWGFPFSLLRHATPEEIKAEEERRKWAVIEEGDVLIGKKSGALAIFIKEFPHHQEARVQVNNGKYQSWDKSSAELYAKKVKTDD